MRYVRGLDGLRAVAVIAVVLFHAEVPLTGGGFLGVSLFFTLSGFLITSLLIAEHDESGMISFRRFYGRRARRLLPAAYLCLLLVVAWSAWWSVEQRAGLRGDVLASVGNVANWRFAFSSTSYQDLFVSVPSPVAHFWSLAIEEQIYLVLPIVVLLALRRGHRALAATTGVLLTASVAATLLTSDRDLVYNGTHTRAAELLVGVVLAQWMAHRRRMVRDPVGSAADSIGFDAEPVVEPAGRRGDWVPGSLALLAFVGLVVWASVDQAWVYRGGLVLVALVSAVLIAAVTDGRFPGRVLEARPLVAVGAVSYGIYLFHWPVFLLLDQARTGLDGVGLFAVRIAATAALTVASYRLVEQPIRRGRVGSRNSVMVPALLAVALLVVAGALTVRGPAPTPTQQVLTIGEERVVEFEPSAIVNPQSPVTAADVAVVGQAAPVSVLVLGTEPSALDALAGAGFAAIDGVDTDCPLTRPASDPCEQLVDRLRTFLRANEANVLVLGFGANDGVEAAAQGPVVGARWKAGEREIAAALDVAIQIGLPVVLFHPATSPTPLDTHFERLELMRPTLGDPVRDVAGLPAAVNDAGSRAKPGSLGAAPSTAELRVLVIGDSTSVNLAKALNDGADGRLAIMWAGANGCPLVPVDGFRASSDAEWVTPDCEAYDTKLAPLLDRFAPDVVVLAVGPTELAEQRFAGDPNTHVAGDAEFAAARDAEFERLVATIGPNVPLLVADVPAITAGFFATEEMTDLGRLAAVNEQVASWDARWPQVARFDYRRHVEAVEAASGSIRSDGVHPDPGPFEDLARSVLVDQLIDQTASLRADLARAR